MVDDKDERMSDTPKYHQMSGYETWGPLSSYAWALFPGAQKPQLVQAWQRQEDGLIQWKALRTVVVDDRGFEVKE